MAAHDWTCYDSIISKVLPAAAAGSAAVVSVMEMPSMPKAAQSQHCFYAARVLLTSVAASTVALGASSVLTTSRRPKNTAVCRGVCPACMRSGPQALPGKVQEQPGKQHTFYTSTQYIQQ
jgi:hypothetical protein